MRTVRIFQIKVVLNRLDETVFYTPLSRAQIGSIMELMLNKLSERLADRQLTVELTERAKEYIAGNGYDPVYGARPLKRFIQRTVETEVAKTIIREEPRPHDRLIVDEDNGELNVTVVSE